MSTVNKFTADKNHRILMDLVALPGNDTCADCKAKAPRWASFNLGIFLCVRCASIHRKIGTHVTKVKSLTLDQWSKEQVDTMKNTGNIKSNEYWNPDEKKHPLPTNMEETERDSELEKFIRSKYEFKRFRSKSALVTQQLGPSQSLSSRSTDLPKRSQTAPIRSEPPSSSQAAPAAFQPPLPLPNQTQPTPAAGVSAPTFQGRSVSSQYPVTRPPRSSSFNPFPTSNAQISNVPGNLAPPANHAASLTSGTFNDLISIQTPASDSSLPLQYQQTLSPMAMSSMNPFPIQPQATSLSANPGNPYANLSTSPALPSSFPNGFGNIRSASLPIPGYSETTQSMQPLSPMPGTSMGGLSVMSTSPFQVSPSTSFNMSGSPNPFNQMQQAQVSQQQTPFAPSVSPSIPMFQPSAPTAQSLTPGGFGQTSALFGAGPGLGMYQPPANVNLGQSSPYATQIQQAQQLFQGMAPGGAGGNANPFRSQWQ